MTDLHIKKKDIVGAILVKTENNNTISQDIEVNNINLSRRLRVHHNATENHPAYVALYTYIFNGVEYDLHCFGVINGNLQKRFQIFTNYNNPTIFKIENDTIILNMIIYM